MKLVYDCEELREIISAHVMRTHGVTRDAIVELQWRGDVRENVPLTITVTMKEAADGPYR